MADVDFINQFDIQVGALYASSKAALNVIIAKFNAQYKKDGVLFLGVSPGVVDTGNFDASACTESCFFISRLPPLLSFPSITPFNPSLSIPPPPFLLFRP